MSPRYPNQNEVTQPLQASSSVGSGIDPDSFEGDMNDVRPAMQKAATKKSAAKCPGAWTSLSLNDDQMSDDYHYYLFPNLTFNIERRSASGFFRQRPHPTDPNKMFFDLQSYVAHPARAPTMAPEARCTRSSSTARFRSAS